jgi:hypothetical protein
MGIEALLLSQVITVTGSTGQVVTKQADGSLALENAAGGSIGGSTGATDNAILRADGTGGATLQNSAFVIADNATASPNNTVNHASIQATGGTTNVSVSIVPKGTGAFSLSLPTGTSAGGNARGANAVDLQRARYSATHVASGENSGILSGSSNISSGQLSTVIGGQENTASGIYAVVLCGQGAVADRYSMLADSSGIFYAFGDAQRVRFVARNRTTGSTPTTLFLNGSSLRLTIPAGKVFAFTARITGIRSDGVSVAEFVRKGVIKRIVNTTSLVGTIEAIGTDIKDNASTDVAITADDTNEALDISVTGIAAETWRWVAVVEGLEIAYGS